MSTDRTEQLRLHLMESLRAAHDARRGVPVALEADVRAYAHALRIAGMPIERALIHIKELVVTTTGSDAPLFTPRVVGWAVAGFFARTGS